MEHVAGTTTHLEAGELRADFLPGLGMLGSSLRHRGRELLRRVEDLPGAAARGSSAGIPLLHPWANRLPGTRYRVAGRAVELDPRSPLLHLDGRGLPMHGVPWSRLAWEVVAACGDRLVASLAWDRPDLLAVFPFRHRLELVVTLGPGDLTLETTLHASPDGPVPVSFGFHPYLGIPGVPRQAWHLRAPEMQRLVLDGRGLPVGDEEPYAGHDGPLGGEGLDDGFALLDGHASFALSGGGWLLAVDFLEGYRYAQLYAPPDQPFIAVEPMTAPAGALASGRGLRLVEPDGAYRAVFRVRVDAAP